MPEFSHYDPEQRQRDKQLVREQDDADMRSGKTSAELLQGRSGFFSEIDLSRASVRRRWTGG